MTVSTTIADADLVVIDDGADGTLRKMTRANFIESAALDNINIDGGDIFINLNPKCEPNLEKRGLFNKVVHLDSGTALSINWVLNLSDGRNSLSDISRISGIEYNLIKETSELLLKHNLLKKIT